MIQINDKSNITSCYFFVKLLLKNIIIFNLNILTTRKLRNLI